ncbi:MAG: hypothetical protein AAGG44_21620 [Planctomycetota bacterium]
MKTHLQNGIVATLAICFMGILSANASAQSYGVVTSKYSSTSTCGPNGCGNRSVNASVVSYATPVRTSSSTAVVSSTVARPSVSYAAPASRVVMSDSYYTPSVRSYYVAPSRSYGVATSGSSCSASSSSRAVSYSYAPSTSYYRSYSSCR